MGGLRSVGERPFHRRQAGRGHSSSSIVSSMASSVFVSVSITSAGRLAAPIVHNGSACRKLLRTGRRVWRRFDGSLGTTSPRHEGCFRRSRTPVQRSGAGHRDGGRGSPFEPHAGAVMKLPDTRHAPSNRQETDPAAAQTSIALGREDKRERFVCRATRRDATGQTRASWTTSRPSLETSPRGRTSPSPCPSSRSRRAASPSRKVARVHPVPVSHERDQARHLRLRSYASVGPPAFFQAVYPPSTWQTRSRPMRRATSVASAERQSRLQ